MFTTLADLTPPPGPDHRCRFVKVNGARCRSHAKPGSDLCCDHHFKKTYSRGRLRPSPPSTFNTVPLVRFAWADDHDAILFNCNQIALALVHSTITAREAGALNAVMYTAQRSLRQKFLHERFEARERAAAAAPCKPEVALSGSPTSSRNPGAPFTPEAGSSGNPGAPFKPSVGLSGYGAPDPEDFVTDYVLDTDGMPLALPDQPVDAAPLSPPAVGEDNAATPTLHPDPGAPFKPSVGLSGNPGAPFKPEVGSSGNPGAPFKPEVGLSGYGAPEPEDFVTDYVLNTDSMPPPQLSDPAPAPLPSAPRETPQEDDPVWIARQRDATLYLREYYKNDPKMLAEIETYPGARYAPKPRYEPESEPITLPALTASADERPRPHPQANSLSPHAERYTLSPVPTIRYAQPQSLPHIRAQAPSKCPVSHT
ncbi:MAG: hypothetical protein WBD93_18680 [Acidobacteriaceae bacterium]